MSTYRYRDIAVTPSPAASRRIENRAGPSASSNRTVAVVIRSRSNPEGASLRRPAGAAGLAAGHTPVRVSPGSAAVTMQAPSSRQVDQPEMPVPPS